MRAAQHVAIAYCTTTIVMVSTNVASDTIDAAIVSKIPVAASGRRHHDNALDDDRIDNVVNGAARAAGVTVDNDVLDMTGTNH